MENYIGKICPFCKAEITETDAVKVCPACGIPHHEGCWNENHGCTTFGCSQQNSEVQPAAPAAVCSCCGAPMGESQAFCPKCGTPKAAAPKKSLCSKCGNELADGQEFCPNCGTPKAAAPKKNLCSKCGNELADGQEFCPNCGQKAGLVIDSAVNSAINEFNAGVEKTKETKKKKPLLIIIAAIAAVVTIAIGALFIPKLLVSVEDLCAQGNYEKAYAKADADEKEDVIAENNIAVCSAITVDSLKDSKSFDLRDAWYNAEKGYVVLKVAANNSYGNTVINYWLFTYDHTEDQEWEIWEAYTSLEDKEYSSYDDNDEFIEKLVYNLGLDYVEATMTSANKLSGSAVKRINTLFSEELLDDVDQLREAIPEKPATSSDNS